MTPTPADAREREALTPCPFCGAGQTQIRDNGKVWTGMRYSEPSSVSVFHWCEPVEGQPSRAVERVGRDRASAIAAWNRRATLATGDAVSPAVEAQAITNALLEQAHEALRDMHAGWKYIRGYHGDLYGVGWDRAQEKAEAAMAALESVLLPAPPSQGGQHV